MCECLQYDSGRYVCEGCEAAVDDALQLRDRMRWRDVREELPPRGERVLVYLERSGRIEIAKCKFHEREYPWEPDADHPTGYSPSEIMKWMPLLEPPEVGDE